MSPRCKLFWALGVGLLLAPAAMGEGSIFITGHDPDFHALLGGNLVGARRINQVGISFVQDPVYNPYVATAPKFLVVESNIPVPGGHTIGEQGIAASGYTPGVHYDKHTAATLNAALNQLGTPGGYSAIVVCSDFGGILTQAELNILNARATDIGNFINSGGGIYAMAEGNSGAGLTPNGGWFSYIPGIVASNPLNQSEVGNTVSVFGALLGLTDANVNGNASHNIFTQIGALAAVDYDAAGNILTAAGRTNVPAPASGAALALLGAATLRRRRR